MLDKPRILPLFFNSFNKFNKTLADPLFIIMQSDLEAILMTFI